MSTETQPLWGVALTFSDTVLAVPSAHHGDALVIALASAGIPSRRVVWTGSAETHERDNAFSQSHAEVSQ